ncbi:MAG: nickel pincer cofactor biosynthesis protein LarC [Candidatus Latescibacterota bacterium]|nr:MAG: nickel pincer cofactor biosynthesis protein LarC [Candidatus Latescibacterota bacterium]
MRWLVFDCPSGISGDMTLAALVDLGVSLDEMREILATLPLAGYRLESEQVTRNGIGATRVRVVLDAEIEHPHRHLRHVVRILRSGQLPPRALDWSLQVFTQLAEAEASVHRMDVESVHFHEVGAVDAIVDIAGVCIGLDRLCALHDVDSLRVSQIRVGRGATRSAHGVIPVPPPATLQLLRGFPIQFTSGEGERVTPTGAAILAALTQPLEDAAIRVEATGLGAGSKEFVDAANVVRLLLCRPAAMPRQRADVTPETRGAAATEARPRSKPSEAEPAARVGVVTTTIDDMVPEFYGYVMERLFAAGALDVYFTPIYMKKGRPATQVTVIGEPHDTHALARLLLNESSTLGVRIAYEERMELERRVTRVCTEYGEVQVKIAVRPDGKLRAVPEYESVRQAAETAGVPLADVYRAALGAEVDDDVGTDKRKA